MPRSAGESIPKYRKHRGSGQAVVTISGRDHYLGPHGTKTSKHEYDRLVGEWMASGRSLAYGVSQHDLTIAELLASYKRFAKTYYGTGAKSEYFHYVRVSRPVVELYGRTPAVAFGPLQFKTVRERLISEGGSRSYVNALMQRVARIFRWAAAEAMIPPDVPAALSMVSGLRRGRTEAPETDPVQPVSDDTVEVTLRELPKVVADMVRLQRLTAARPAEICSLRPCDLDRSGEVWTYHPQKHKTQHHGKTRQIFIGPKGQAILLRYLVRDAEAYCFRPVDSEEKRRAEVHAKRKTPLSHGNKPGSKQAKRGKRRAKWQPGECYATDSYRRAIHRACDRAFLHPELGKIKKANLTTKQREELCRWQSSKRWSPNQLRHSAATEVRREFGLEAAQVILGHSAAAVTEIYAERDMAKGAEVALRIG
ncbi:MAG: site-specific integrase [Planctomycetes bacterium]|nr:site-specific integrase [Planctomycetota bacterium]